MDHRPPRVTYLRLPRVGVTRGEVGSEGVRANVRA